MSLRQKDYLTESIPLRELNLFVKGLGGIIHLVMVQGQDMGTDGNFGLIVIMTSLTIKPY